MLRITKFLDVNTMLKHMDTFNIVYMSGRAAEAPQLSGIDYAFQCFFPVVGQAQDGGEVRGKALRADMACPLPSQPHNHLMITKFFKRRTFFAKVTCHKPV